MFHSTYHSTWCTVTSCEPVILYRIAGNFCVVQNFAIFVNRLAFAKIRTVKIASIAVSKAPHLPVRAGAAKTKTAKIFFGCPQSQFRKKISTIRYQMYKLDIISITICTHFSKSHV